MASRVRRYHIAVESELSMNGITSMINLRYVILSVVLIISACASKDKLHYQPEVRALDKPVIGEITTAGLGDALVVQGQEIFSDVVIFPKPIYLKGIINSILPAGTYRKIYETEAADFFRPIKTTELNSPDHTVLEIMVSKVTAKYIFVKTSKTYLASDQVNYERKKVALVEDNNFQQTLIYSGRIGDKLNIEYREINSGHARPAFNNRVEYNLENSNIIGYKGARIEVIDANNQKITYRLLKNFDQIN